jgi:hypothetical protein
MRHLRLVGLAVLAMLVVASPASAQRTRARSSSATEKSLWEIGVDAALSLGLDSPRRNTVSIPVGSIRAGVFTSDVLEIEPFFSLNNFSGQGITSVTTYQFGVGGLYHFSPDRTKSQIYVRPFLSLVGASGGGTSNSDVGIGIGAGMKLPKLNARAAWRGEVNFMTVNNASSLNFLVGGSFFTR